jgi:ligand-binding sensor domain-containing protein
MRPYFSLLFFLAGLHFLPAQNDSIFPQLAIGEWRQHLPWQRAKYVTQSEEIVFFATEWAVVALDKEDRSTRYITKVEGLSDVGLSLLRYNSAAKVLLLVYTNSNIDLYYPEDQSVLNLPIIQKNPNIVGDRRIYSVFFDGKTAYFACGFGVLKFDLEDAEAEYTVFTNIPVRSFAIYNGYLWAGTETGLYRLPENDENPADFSRWEAADEAAGFPFGISYNHLAVFNNKLAIGAENRLMEYDGNIASEITQHPERQITYMSTEGPGLMIGWGNPDDFGRGAVEYIEPSGARIEVHWTCDAEYPLYGIEDGAKKFWFADLDDQFRYFDYNTNQCDAFSFNSPYNQATSEITFSADGSTTYVATPGPASNLGVVGFRDGVYRYKNGLWRRWSEKTTPALVDSSESFKDMWRVEAHPSEDKFFVGSWVGGLMQFSNDEYEKKYTQFNSILQSAGNSGGLRTAIGGLDYDEEGNLWISNYGANSPIAVLKADGVLKNFNASPANNLLQVKVDQNGYKWFVIAFNAGILVYDSGADIDSPSDDRYRIINTANSVLPTNFINCIEVDLDGDVWVGTQQGVVSFECGSNVFDDECKGRRRIVNVDGFNGYLLETEDVKTIAIDGANQKWFGTTNGVFVQSPDALTQIARYTNTNSPLFDNAITDIAINPITGEAWIGTEKGLISLRTGAVAGGRVNRPSAYAYPNPVQPGYDGPIAIYGLARDANIKITDAAGQLVYEGKALGGQAVWDGRDYLGRRAASGVYLIFATSEANFDDPDAIVTKLVLLN